MKPPVILARQTMGTRFEFVLYGDDPTHLQAAGEEALDEISRLNSELGFHQPGSEIARLNSHAAKGPVKVSPLLFDLLRQSIDLNHKTEGTFDITVAPLIICWGLATGEGRFPEPEEVKEAMELVGSDRLQLNESDHTVAFDREGVMLDLGSIGKGLALDIAAEWLQEAGIQNALIHGGTSTVYAIGSPPDADAWSVGVVKPEDGPTLSTETPAEDENLLATVQLKDESLSVSAIWGKSFEKDGRTYGHVIDTRIGEPVSGAYLSAVIHPNATESDALATALLTLGEPGPDLISKSFPDARTLIALPTGDADGYRTINRI